MEVVLGVGVAPTRRNSKGTAAVAENSGELVPQPGGMILRGRRGETERSVRATNRQAGALNPGLKRLR